MDIALSDVTKAGRHELLFQLARTPEDRHAFLVGNVRYPFPDTDRMVPPSGSSNPAMHLYGVPMPSLHSLGRTTVDDAARNDYAAVIATVNLHTEVCKLPYSKWTWGNTILERNKNYMNLKCAPLFMNLNDDMDYTVDRTLISNEEYGMGLLKYNGACNGDKMTILIDVGAGGTPTRYDALGKV